MTFDQLQLLKRNRHSESKKKHEVFTFTNWWCKIDDYHTLHDMLWGEIVDIIFKSWSLRRSRCYSLLLEGKVLLGLNEAVEQIALLAVIVLGQVVTRALALWHGELSFDWELGRLRFIIIRPRRRLGTNRRRNWRYAWKSKRVRRGKGKNSCIPGEDSLGFLAGGCPALEVELVLEPPEACFIFGTELSSFSSLLSLDACDSPLMRSSSAAARNIWRSSWFTFT